MSSSPKIRVGIIGLSASATTSWAANSHLPYLSKPSSPYTITALCNSSVSAAEAAVKAFYLPPTTKAHGDPKSIAEDPDVDFVVCCTRVDKHFDTILPSLKAGKDVFVEWPLVANVEQATILANIAKEKKTKTVVGLQGWFTPIAAKVMELLDAGRIGKVLGSDVRGHGGIADRSSLPEGLSYFAEKAVGGNIITIGMGHMIDSVHRVLGEFDTFHAQSSIQRPEVILKDPKTKEVTGSITSDVPDIASVHGPLEESSRVKAGALLTVMLRKGSAFKGTPSFVWTITGEKGELRIVSPESTSIQAFVDLQTVSIEVEDFGTDKVEKLGLEWDDDVKDLPGPAKNMATLYKTFAAGKEGQYPSIPHAAARIEEMAVIVDSGGR